MDRSTRRKAGAFYFAGRAALTRLARQFRNALRFLGECQAADDREFFDRLVNLGGHQEPLRSKIGSQRRVLSCDAGLLEAPQIDVGFGASVSQLSKAVIENPTC